MRKKMSASRKLLIGAGLVLVLLVALIALLPMLISSGLGHGMVRNAIEDQINGTADFQDLSITWSGPQEIYDLRIVDDTGREAALLHASVDQGLLSLLFTDTALDIIVAGTARGEWYEDGSVSFQRLVREDPEPETDEPFNLENVPEMTVTIAGLTAFVHDVAADQEIILEDLAGYFVYSPGNDLRFDIQGATVADQMRGTVAASGEAPGLFDAAGRMRPQGIPLIVQLAVSTIPIPGINGQSVLHDMTLRMQAQDLTQMVSLTMQGQGTMADEQPSRFSGEFRLRNPIQQDGTIDFDLERIDGRLSGEAVPSSLLQPAFNNTPVVLSRDIGRTIDLDVRLEPDAEAAAMITAVGELGTVELAATHRDGWWTGDNVVLRTPQAHPELIEGYTGLTIQEPTDLEIVLTSFAIPPVDPELEARPWGLAGATGSLRINGPANLIIPRDTADEPDADPDPEADPDALGPMQFTLSDVQLNIDAAELGDTLYLTGSMNVDGGQVAVDHTITNLADEQGRIDAAAAEPVGTLTIADLPSSVAAQFVPQQQDVLQEVLGQVVSATLRTELVENGLQAQLQTQGQALQAEFTAVRTPTALQLRTGRAELTASPALAEAILADAMDEPLELTEPASLAFELLPMEFPGSAPMDYQFRSIPIAGNLSATNLALANVPGIEEALGVYDLAATVEARFDEQLEQWAFTVDGDAALMRANEDQQVAALAYTLATDPRPDQPTLINGTVAMTELAVNNLEALLGRQQDTFANWVGEAGDVRVEFQTVEDEYRATITPQFERITGAFAATLRDELLTLNTENATINLAAAAMENLLATADEAAAVDVLEDVTFGLELAAAMPLSLLTDEPFDPQQVDISTQLTGGPLMLVSEGQQSTLSDVAMSIRSEAVGEELDFIISIDAAISESPATAQSGEIDVQGRVSQLASGGAFGFEHAVLDLEATIVRAPAVLADALLNMNGYLVSTVGHEFNATINATQFSRTGGALSTDITTANGWLRAAGTGGQEVLSYAEGSPIEGELELTPLLRDRVLRNLHPVLSDILSMPQPMHLLVSNATLPLDGDITRLNADIELTMGEVDFDARSPMFVMLQAANVADISRLDGFIDPIRAQVRNGIITYDQFNITVDDLRMPYQGRIDLTTGSVDLQTALPLGELLVSGIREVPDEAAAIIVPLVTRGEFGELSTQIDPEFDLARAMLEAGVQRGLEEIFPRDRLPFDLRDIFPRR